MIASDILKLTVENDVHPLTNLPPPEDLLTPPYKANELINISKNFRKIWIGLLTNEIHIPQTKVDTECVTCGKETTLSGDLLWSRVLLSIGAYYDYATRAYICLPRSKQHKPAPILPPHIIKESLVNSVDGLNV